MGRKTSCIKLEDNIRTRLKPNPRTVMSAYTQSSYQTVTGLTIRIAQTHIPSGCLSRQSDMTPEDPTELLGVSNG
jgi:hypothetical protein